MEERNITYPLKPVDSKPQGRDLDEPDSEDKIINEDSAQEKTADVQEVQQIEPHANPGVSDTSPEASEEHGPLEQAERSESQQQLPQPELQERKIQNALASITLLCDEKGLAWQCIHSVFLDTFSYSY